MDDFREELFNFIADRSVNTTVRDMQKQFPDVSQQKIRRDIEALRSDLRIRQVGLNPISFIASIKLDYKPAETSPGIIEKRVIR